MKLEEKSRNFLKFTFFGIAIILVTLLVGRLPVSREVERVTSDFRFRTRRFSAVDPRISLVLVDSTAIHKYGYPFPRDPYAKVVNALCISDARAVVVDRTFEAKDLMALKRTSAIGNEMDDTRLLAWVFGQYDNIIAAWYSPTTEETFLDDQPVIPERFAMPHRPKEIAISPYETSLRPSQVSLPYHQALQSIHRLGAIVAKKARGNRIEKVPLVVKHGNRIYPSISLLAACIALNVDLADIVFKPEEVCIPTRDGIITIPTDEKGQIMVNYVGDRSVFLEQQHSLAGMYESIRTGELSVPIESFRNRVVLIGNDDIMGADMYFTPFGKVLTPGVAIHAMVINSILQGEFLYIAPWYLNFLILSAAVFSISYIQGIFSPRIGPIYLALLLVCIGAIAFVAFQFRGILLNVSQPVFGMILGFSSAAFHNYLTERRRVNHIKWVFGKHVSQEIMDRIVLEGDGQVPMTEREVTALFADITDHSRWARHLKPAKFAEELNECLEAMAQAVFDNNGTINVFLGDGLLAIYNAPIEQKDHALRAIKTGIAIQDNIAELNEKRIVQDKMPIAVRVGINTGFAMAGTLGSKERLEYTVVGDTINMASRTEGKCEPGRVAITDDVLRKVDGMVQVESIGTQPVKGREEGLILYHVVGIGKEDKQSETDIATKSTKEELLTIASAPLQ